MIPTVRVSSDLWHDGDHITEYDFLATNQRFSGAARVYGNDDEHIDFADSIAGFPLAGQRRITVSFGGGPTTCELVFETTGSLGLIKLVVRISSDEGDASETVKLAMTIEPVALDEFVRQLRSFHPGMENSAELRGNVA